MALPVRRVGQRNGTCRTDALRSPWVACFPDPVQRRAGSSVEPTSSRFRSGGSGARTRSEGCERATTGRRALEGNQKPMEGKRSEQHAATRVPVSVSHTEKSLEVGTFGCVAQAARCESSNGEGAERGSDAEELCGSGVLRRVQCTSGRATAHDPNASTSSLRQ